MNLQEVIRWLEREDGRALRGMTRGCRECRRFVRRFHRQGNPVNVRWEDVPELLLYRFSRRLHEQLFQY